MKLIFTLAVFCFGLTAVAQPVLLKDIHDESTFPSGSGLNSPGLDDIQIKFNGRIFFVAYTLGTGYALYSTDGTAEGTQLFQDIFPGEADMHINSAVVLDDRFLFSVPNFTQPDGPTIWESDGTKEGTHPLVKAYARSLLVAQDGMIYFTGYDEDHGVELWRSDGTQEGTFMIKDINEGPANSTPLTKDTHQAVVVGNKVYFVANDGPHSSELWRTDGTEEGTEMVADINPAGDGVLAEYFTVVDNTLYFSATDNTLWKVDDNTVPKKLSEDVFFADSEMVLLGDKLVAYATNSETGGELFTIDTNTDEVDLLKDIIPGVQSSWVGVTLQFVVVDDEAYFTSFADGGHGLWKTDGTEANTVPLVTFDEELNGLSGPSYIDGKFYVIHARTASSYQLLATDGESEFELLTEQKSISNLADVNGKVLMFAEDYPHGREPWISDGTVLGTHLLKDINVQTPMSIYEMARVGNKLIFSSTESKQTLWSSNGTEAGTSPLLVRPIIRDLSSNGSKAMFTVYDSEYGAEPWITDGTAEGTRMVKDLVEGPPPGIGNPPQYTWVGDVAYFYAGLNELWKTDGTNVGTVKVTTLEYDDYKSVVFKNQLYFFIRHQLWKSDGTNAGTVKIKDVGPEDAYFEVAEVIAGADKMYFATFSDLYGSEIFVSDGTPDGTHLVKDINPAEMSVGYVTSLGAVANDIAYLRASESDPLSDGFTMQLWRSDGTEEGTYLLKDVAVDDIYFNSTQFNTMNGLVYFAANDGDHGNELWRTDGTTEGTVIVKDIYPGKYSSDPGMSIVIDGELFFNARDAEHGKELWKTDGTTANTVLVGEVTPGSSSSLFIQPKFTRVGNRLFFVPATSPKGEEVWLYQLKEEEEPIVGFEDQDPAVSVFPNPATNAINIKVPGNFEALAILDMLGRNVITSIINQSETSIDVSHLARSMYVIHLKATDQTTITKKILLK